MKEKLNIQIGDLRTEGPVYAQVRRQLEKLLAEQAVASGEPLPSPALLAQQLSVDKGEIQRAYFELERTGRLKKRTGRDFLGKEKTTYTAS